MLPTPNQLLPQCSSTLTAHIAHVGPKAESCRPTLSRPDPQTPCGKDWLLEPEWEKRSDCTTRSERTARDWASATYFVSPRVSSKPSDSSCTAASGNCTAGFSVAYSLATALFSGFTPAVSTYLIHATGNRAVAGLWLMFAAASGFCVTLLAYRRSVDAAWPVTTASQAD